jgi:RTX calcium-binding nonapeptide repeat (4 copies)
MRRLLISLVPIAAALFAAASSDLASGDALRRPCRREGAIIGYLPSVKVSPCGGGIRSGGDLYRGDRVSATAIGEVTFQTQHVLRCTLSNGSAVIYPTPFVVLKLMRGSISCKQAGGMPRWKFKGPNVSVRIVQAAASRTLREDKGGGETIFAIVASKKTTAVKVYEGVARASAHGASRTVGGGSQVIVQSHRAPSQAREFTPTAKQVQTFAALKNDVTTTTTADVPNLFTSQNQHYGVLISENPAVADQVAKTLRNVKLLKLSADDARGDPQATASAIKRYPARIVIVAGALTTMSSVLEELNDPDFQGLVGKELTVVFVPIKTPANTCLGRVATIAGTAGDDILQGTAADDVIIGQGGNDVIRGNDGADIICGGANNDDIDGGQGSDQIDGGDGDDSAQGSGGNDIIAGGAGNDYLDGGVGGCCTESTNNGDDELIGGDGNDELWSSDFGRATMRGGPGDDHLHGLNGSDSLEGGAGADILDGGAGDDTIIGGSGSDLLNGLEGDDTLDSVDLIAGNDRNDGGFGSDTCRGDDGDVFLGCDNSGAARSQFELRSSPANVLTVRHQKPRRSARDTGSKIWASASISLRVGAARARTETRSSGALELGLVF